MTASQLHDARMLIPGAYELNAPPHRATRSAHAVPAGAPEDVRPRAANADTAHVVAAPTRPTTPLGYAAAVLMDLALIAGLIYGVAVIPALVGWSIKGAAALIVGTFGGH